MSKISQEFNSGINSSSIKIARNSMSNKQVLNHFKLDDYQSNQLESDLYKKFYIHNHRNPIQQSQLSYEFSWTQIFIKILINMLFIAIYSSQLLGIHNQYVDKVEDYLFYSLISLYLIVVCQDLFLSDISNVIKNSMNFQKSKDLIQYHRNKVPNLKLNIDCYHTISELDDNIEESSDPLLRKKKDCRFITFSEQVEHKFLQWADVTPSFDQIYDQNAQVKINLFSRCVVSDEDSMDSLKIKFDEFVKKNQRKDKMYNSYINYEKNIDEIIYCNINSCPIMYQLTFMLFSVLNINSVQYIQFKICFKEYDQPILKITGNSELEQYN